MSEKIVTKANAEEANNRRSAERHDGEIHGDLKILYPDPTNPKAYYVCECLKCGWRGSVRYDGIVKYGHSSKCNCCRTKQRAYDCTSLIGRRYGDLLVTGFDHDSRKEKGAKSKWICKCLLCGNSIRVTKSNLVNGISTKCRVCSDKIINENKTINKVEIGDRFGKSDDPVKHVIVTGMDRYDADNRAYYWRWRCNFCGNEGVSSSYILHHVESICVKCSEIQNLKNRKFNKLLVIGLIEAKTKKCGIWRCLCDCGNVIEVKDTDLLSGNVLSCGCDPYKAGESSDYPPYILHDLRSRYNGMYKRCYKETDISYPYYGAKGIRVDDRWLGDDGFNNFIKDMGPTFDPSLTLDRIDPYKNYSPDNCRWLSNKEQQNNRTDNVPTEYNGKQYKSTRAVMDDLIERGYINKDDPRVALLHTRLTNGWTLKEAINIPAPISKLSVWLKEHNLESTDDLPDWPIRTAVTFRSPRVFDNCNPREIPYYDDEFHGSLPNMPEIDLDVEQRGITKFVRRIK